MDKGFIESKINIPKVKDKLVKRIALFNKLINTCSIAPASPLMSGMSSEKLVFNSKS